MTEKSALIIGYGSAGKRHEMTLKQLGYRVTTYDPDPWRNAHIADPDLLYKDYLLREFSFGVIATPPDLHWEYIICLLAHNFNVVCEKPLFGFGELTDKDIYSSYYFSKLELVAVTYNYFYHPNLVRAIEEKDRLVHKRNWWFLEAGQYRAHPPAWGYVLDHISHDIDILRTMSDSSSDDFVIKSAVQKESLTHDSIGVSGSIGSNNFEILETVYKSPVRRYANINTPWGWYEIDANPAMFLYMWKSIESAFKHKYIPPTNFFSALETQRILERIKKEIANG